MKTGYSSLNELWGQIVIKELIRSGVNSFVVSPGSRSAPLVYSLSQNKQAVSVISYDERSAAFYALGQARATGKPTALICTSGTAGANYLPAVIESSVDHVPMIILTADRPSELRNTGANQTIDQVKIFGDYVRFFFDLPCPNQNIAPEFVLSTVDQAVYRATNSPKGPVHLNFMFREPLAPTTKKQNFNTYLRSISPWNKSQSPFTKYALSKSTVSDSELKEVSSIINKTSSGLIIAGKMNQRDSRALLKLTDKLGWPVFPDIASGLRLGAKSENVIAYFDQLLVSDKLSFKPTTVLQFSDQPVSKRLMQFLERTRPSEYISLADHPERLDPNHQVTLRIESDISDFCKRLSSKVTKTRTNQSNKLIEMSRRAAAVISQQLESNSSELNEPLLARLISKNINKTGALFLASSLPVREMDMFAASGVPNIQVEYNRGASGIDGTMASAVGYANGLKKQVSLLIGDLALLHDLNSLELVRNSRHPLIIVILNNDGGGIFSFLPVAEIGEGFEKFFGTPHGLSFKQSAEQFELLYFNPKSPNEFIKIYNELQSKRESAVIEIKTDRKANHALHKKIQGAVRKAIGKA